MTNGSSPSRPSSYHLSPPTSPRGSLSTSTSLSQRKSIRELPPLPSQHRSTTPPGTPPSTLSPDFLEAVPPPPPKSQRSPSLSRTSYTSHISQESLKSAPLSPSASVSSPPLKHRPQSLNNILDAGSPSSQGKSKVSLVPSEGEDLDAFHVRNTYAQLDMSGVKGDGYTEGVERTRARIGDSRVSQANAAAAIGDGTEKQGDLDPREVEVLSSIDRYGFFITPNHERLVLLPSLPFKQKLTNVSTGPPNAPTTGTSLRSLPPPQPPIKELSRIGKWERMLRPQKPQPGGNPEGWYIKPTKEGKLLERVYKGIPDRWRSVAWEILMSRFTSKAIREKGLGIEEVRNMNLDVLREDYLDGMEKPSSYDIQIDLDVPRTISGHVLFKTRYGAGQRSLFHVLHSFSLRCSTCGYVQGMGPLAATLLCYLPPDQVYASLVRLHDHYDLHTIFSPGFPGLLEAIYVQERLTQQMMPGVYKAFQDQTVSTTSYATKWYITCFANSVPFQTQLRVWDVFLAEGGDVFVVLAVGIVWVFRDQITSSSANFETILSLLSSFFVPEDENALMSWVGKVMTDSTIRGNMRRWREEWKELVKNGKDATALL
ncbi:RabGAP/TBC [Dendrothele bispora CBS 962.96]|uniref:RabGAP/TBC n=1 Tax=Dendrothele bispora (strain CBS 962.96) TaxID=1314807 RepID=A0A4S8MTZ3_DENBC|nr:RabGAP/TBC [Dendrothele bispora CBS 962.96]